MNAVAEQEEIKAHLISKAQEQIERREEVIEEYKKVLEKLHSKVA